MAKTKIQGNEINTYSDMPSIGDLAAEFILTKNDLSIATLSSYKGKRIVMNIFPSIDTGVCARSVKKFNEEAAKLDNTVVLCISRDLPFAMARFCGTEGINNVVTLSEMTNRKFGKDYGLEIIDGPFTGLLARAVVVVNEEGKVIYTELVDDIVHEPNYTKALQAITGQ